MYLATVRITLRPSILDPQGKAVQHALHELGHHEVEGVRAGKLIQLTLDVDTAEAAHRVASEAAEKLLANPVMEDFEIEVKETAAA